MKHYQYKGGEHPFDFFSPSNLDRSAPPPLLTDFAHWGKDGRIPFIPILYAPYQITAPGRCYQKLPLKSDRSSRKTHLPVPSSPRHLHRLQYWEVTYSAFILLPTKWYVLSFKYQGPSKPPSAFSQAHFPLNFSNLLLPWGKFNPHVSGSFTLNSSKCCAVRAIWCHRSLVGLIYKCLFFEPGS